MFVKLIFVYGFILHLYMPISISVRTTLSKIIFILSRIYIAEYNLQNIHCGILITEYTLRNINYRIYMRNVTLTDYILQNITFAEYYIAEFILQNITFGGMALFWVLLALPRAYGESL